jgi:uncharacterized protein (DUF1800 family)
MVARQALRTRIAQALSPHAATERLLVARIQHRLGFGPRPGEYLAALNIGFDRARENALTPPVVDPGLAKLSDPTIANLGLYPTPGTLARTMFERSRREMSMALELWALDRMVAATHGLTERMTWFWHGHWATAISKVETPLPMYNYYKTLNQFALGHFGEMTRAMVNDGAVVYWLDGGQNTASAPNENLARELMELFTLGVGNYSEDDVKSAAKALTGYKVDRNSGLVSFRTRDHYAAPVQLLGASRSFDANSLADFLTSQPQCPKFLAGRLWYRFISSSVPLPNNSSIAAALGRNLIIADGVRALASDAGFSDPANAQVKAPIEWFVSVCRALAIMPSAIASHLAVLDILRSFSQLVFDPPSVGGWPADEAWLSTASAQLRISTASKIVALGDVSPIESLPVGERVQGAADWLGVPAWSRRTSQALDSARKDPAALAVLAITSPEYLVNA